MTLEERVEREMNTLPPYSLTREDVTALVTRLVRTIMRLEAGRK